MRKFIGLIAALAVLAMLPGFAESQAIGGRYTGASMHPEDVLALNIFVPEETFNGSFQHTKPDNSLLPGVWPGVGLPSAPGVAPDLVYLQKKI